MCIRDRITTEKAVTMIDPKPVSYTHLDVYKRQVLGRAVVEGRVGDDQLQGRLGGPAEPVALDHGHPLAVRLLSLIHI